mmetsp:Transcript_28768/g.45531  ORF Transcript_28768/g.45531 Transcript_28768/m.45531 type:complete len:270 (+) Transcript_28768:182-991(+)
MIPQNRKHNLCKTPIELLHQNLIKNPSHLLRRIIKYATSQRTQHHRIMSILIRNPTNRADLILIRFHLIGLQRTHALMHSGSHRNRRNHTSLIQRQHSISFVLRSTKHVHIPRVHAAKFIVHRIKTLLLSNSVVLRFHLLLRLLRLFLFTTLFIFRLLLVLENIAISISRIMRNLAISMRPQRQIQTGAFENILFLSASLRVSMRSSSRSARIGQVEHHWIIARLLESQRSHNTVCIRGGDLHLRHIRSRCIGWDLLGWLLVAVTDAVL